MYSQLNLVAVGNAMVDLLVTAEERELSRLGMRKNAMNLIDEDRADFLAGHLKSPHIEPGGSAGNTAVSFAALGGKVAYAGKVRDDSFGKAFADALGESGVRYSVPKADEGPGTGRCYILVTPDGARTMNTFLGAATRLGPDDIDPGIMGNAALVYLEGYLWDEPQAKAAFHKAIDSAHKSGGKVALSLSDPFCVERWRDEFSELVSRNVDILFATDTELTALYQCNSLEESLDIVESEVELAFITCGANGAYAVSRENVQDYRLFLPAHPVKKRVDTTGAGDIFAAGALLMLSRNSSLKEVLTFAHRAASEVIQIMGPRLRPEQIARLKALLPG